jgi:hypothetical protein
VGRYFGGSRYRITDRSRERIEAGIRDALALVTPMAVFAVHAIERSGEPGGIRLENGVTLDLPCCGDPAGARFLSAGVATLGSGLDDGCRRLAAQGAVYQATLLDAVGIALLDALGDACAARIEARARALGLHAGRRMAPGTAGLPLSHQKVLFTLVNAGLIGVRLNSDLMMAPVKSISFFSFCQAARETAFERSKCARCGMPGCGFRERPEMPWTQAKGSAVPAPALP